MKIGILGAGNLGTTLGKAWAKHGHEVIYGVRDRNAPKVQALLDATIGKRYAATIADTATKAEIVALTVLWDAVPEIVQQIGDLSGKICLDCTNPLVANALHDMAAVATSGGEQIAEWLPKARVVKIFNTVGWETIEKPQYNGERATMFYAGDDAQAKAIASQLATEIGFEAIDAGSLSTSKYLENLAGLWGQIAYGQGMGREIGWRLLQR